MTLSSVQFSRSVGSDSLRPHESQHARPPPSPTPGVHWDSHPSSQWCHPAISSSFVPFSSCPQSLPASESFPMTQLLAWGGQSIAVSALASFLPKKSQGWSPSEWTVGSPCSPRDSQESSPTPQFKSINSSVLSFLHSPTFTSIHDHWSAPNCSWCILKSPNLLPSYHVLIGHSLHLSSMLDPCFLDLLIFWFTPSF